MPPSDKKTRLLPSLKLSQNIRKAIEKNIGYEEELIRTLQDVDIKKRIALNEITLKKDAFLRQQRRRRESLPAVLTRNSLNQPLVISRSWARDDLECSTKPASMFPSYSKTITRRTEQLPSLPGVKIESGVGSDKNSCALSDSQAGIKSAQEQSSESDSLQLVSERKTATNSVLKVQSWPPSPSVHLGKSILKRGTSVTDVTGQANNEAAESAAGQPTWLRRQTLHHIFHSTTSIPRASETQTNPSISDPCLMQTSKEVSAKDSTQSRYRKVLNRRRSLQVGAYYQSTCSMERIGGNRAGQPNSKSLEDCHVLNTTNKTQRCRRVSFQDSWT